MMLNDGLFDKQLSIHLNTNSCQSRCKLSHCNKDLGIETRNVIPVIEINARIKARNYRGGGGGGLPGGGGGGVKLDGAGTVPLPVCAGGPPLIRPDTGTRCPLAYMH